MKVKKIFCRVLSVIAVLSIACASFNTFAQVEPVIEKTEAIEVAPTPEILTGKTMRQVPNAAVVVKDFMALSKISGSWQNASGTGSQEYDIDFSTKTLEWYTTARTKRKGSCTRIDYDVDKVLEDKDYLYVLTKRKNSGNVFCPKGGFPLLMEISKSKKDGFYSLQASEGTLK
jgi:hypothetical protein